MLRIAADGCLYLTEYGQPEALHRARDAGDGLQGRQRQSRCRSISRAVCCPVKRRSRKARVYLKTVQAVDACYRSAQTGMVVNLG